MTKRKATAVDKWSAVLCLILLALEWFHGSISLYGAIVTLVCVVPFVHVCYIWIFGLDAYKVNQLKIPVEQDLAPVANKLFGIERGRKATFTMIILLIFYFGFGIGHASSSVTADNFADEVQKASNGNIVLDDVQTTTYKNKSMYSADTDNGLTLLTAMQDNNGDLSNFMVWTKVNTSEMDEAQMGQYEQTIQAVMQIVDPSLSPSDCEQIQDDNLDFMDVYDNGVEHDFKKDGKSYTLKGGAGAMMFFMVN